MMLTSNNPTVVENPPRFSTVSSIASPKNTWPHLALCPPGIVRHQGESPSGNLSPPSNVSLATWAVPATWALLARINKNNGVKSIRANKWQTCSDLYNQQFWITIRHMPNTRQKYLKRTQNLYHSANDDNDGLDFDRWRIVVKKEPKEEGKTGETFSPRDFQSKDIRFQGHSVLRTFGPKDFQSQGLSVPRTFGPKDFRSKSLSVQETFGPRDQQTTNNQSLTNRTKDAPMIHT